MEILFVVNQHNIFDPVFGASQRGNLLLNACARVGHVDVVMFRNFEAESNVDNCDIIFQKNIDDKYNILNKIRRNLRCLFSTRYERIYRICSEKAEIIKSILQKKHYDLIVVRYIPHAINCGLMDYADRLVIDMDDNPIDCKDQAFEKKLKKKNVNFWDRFLRYFIVESYKKALDKVLNKTKVVFASNQEDVHANLVFLPNIPFNNSTNSLHSFDTAENKVLFVGVLDWPPNFEGISHFLDYIFPIIQKSVSNVEIDVVGKLGDDDISRWSNNPKIHFRGFIEDLNQEYKEAKVAVVPCYSGGGTNIKVLEAMQQMRPCVTTKSGSRGHRQFFENRKDFLVSETDQEFAEWVIKMLTDKTANHSIARNAHVKIQVFYNREVFYDIVKNAII